jgi:hypothetical protein
MTEIRQAYLQAAASAADLLAAPEVAAAWAAPSALRGFTVGGLAAHLAGQVLFVAGTVTGPAPEQETVTLPGHYAKVTWLAAPLDEETNMVILRNGESGAAAGPAAVVEAVDAALRELPGLLAAQPEDKVVRPPAGPWGLTLDDFLVTRMMEIAVHNDDLAVSVGVPAPELPAEVLDPVLALLTSLAVRRHGAVPVLRALSRRERAPETITAF